MGPLNSVETILNIFATVVLKQSGSVFADKQQINTRTVNCHLIREQVAIFQERDASLHRDLPCGPCGATMKAVRRNRFLLAPTPSMRIHVMWLIIESICSTYVVKKPISSPEHSPASLPACLIRVYSTPTSLTFTWTSLLAFVPFLQDKSISQRTQTLE